MSPTEIAKQIENELLENVSKALEGGAYGTAAWQIEKLARAGALNQENQSTIRKYIEALAEAVSEELAEDITSYSERLEALFEKATKAGIPLSAVAPPDLREIILAAERSQSGLVNLIANSMLSGADEVYVNTINIATMKVLGGAEGGEKALVSVLRQWAEKGLPGLTDAAGRTWSPEAYVRMEMQTAKTNAFTKMCLERSEEYGSDLVEIDSHAGARPGCAPYQGRVFSLSGGDETYPAFSSTSYGQASGLFGINCGHNMYPFFEGFSEQTYQPYDEEANAEAYKDSQRQRLLERRIRDAKREVSVLEAGGFDSTEARALVRQRQATMRDFIDESGRTRRYAREQIVAPGEAVQLQKTA